MIEKFTGLHTALVTPFEGNEIDFNSLEKLIQNQIDQKVDGIVVLGTTGESCVLTENEKTEIVKIAISMCKNKLPVIVGVGSNNTHQTVNFTKKAVQLGADALLVVAPYYNKPSQEGMFLHFSEIAKSTEKPIILYSIPSRCGVEIAIQTISRLQKSYKNIIGIKEAGGSCNRVSEIKKEVGEDFLILSGDDSLTLPFLAIGAKGVISVASNMIIEPMRKMIDSALKNNLENASEINKLLYLLFKNLMIETNPTPIKEALFLKGIINSSEVRLPLCQLNSQNKKILQDTLTLTEKNLGKMNLKF